MLSCIAAPKSLHSLTSPHHTNTSFCPTPSPSYRLSVITSHSTISFSGYSSPIMSSNRQIALVWILGHVGLFKKTIQSIKRRNKQPCCHILVLISQSHVTWNLINTLPTNGEWVNRKSSISNSQQSNSNQLIDQHSIASFRREKIVITRIRMPTSSQTFCTLHSHTAM